MTLHLRPLPNAHKDQLAVLRAETHAKLIEEVKRDREPSKSERRKRRFYWNKD